MDYILAPLPYSYDALEPYIDAKTMEIHYTKHHQAYVDNLNKALAKHPELYKKKLPELLVDLSQIPEDIRTAVRNNGGGNYNHTMFWLLMKKNGGGLPRGDIDQAIKKNFGTFAAFQEQFNTSAKSVFGSGWTWLCLDSQERLRIINTANQDTPLQERLFPIFGLDVWEHAYYLKYQNRRPDYITAWWHVVNWQQIEENYQNYVK